MMCRSSLVRAATLSVLGLLFADAARAQVPAPESSPLVPLVLLRRSALKAPEGSDDVLVPAKATADPIAARVAKLASTPSSYLQFVLRLDRYAKTYLLNDPRVPESKRQALRQPAFLFLSDRQGGFPVEHFWLEQPDGRLRQMREVTFVDTVVDEQDLEPGRIDGLEAIYAHELGHLMMADLAGPAPRKASSAMHFISVRTDPWYAFTEGFGEHFQPASLDHAAGAGAASRRPVPLAPRVQQWQARFAREQEQGCFICPANLRFLNWHGGGEQWMRDGAVRENAFIRHSPLPASLAGNARPAFEAQMYRDVMPPRACGSLRNAVEMLESEGVMATLFYRLASDRRLQERYRPSEFYRPFLGQEAQAALASSGPSALVSPSENIYLKLFAVMRHHFSWDPWPAIALVNGYAEAYPDEASAAYDVFLSVTRGVTVQREARVRHDEPGYLDLLRDRLVRREIALDAAMPPTLWMQAGGFSLGMGLYRYFPVPNPFTFNLNSADLPDLRAGAGVSAETAGAIIAAREARGGFRTVAELSGIPGVTPELVGELEKMHRRMQERFSRAAPVRKDSGWLRDYLVMILRGCYHLAAAWQFTRAMFLSGLGFLAVGFVATRLAPSTSLAAATVPPGGRRRWVRRTLKAVLRAMGYAFIPCAASVLLYASGTMPGPLNMALVGVGLGAAWCLFLVAGRGVTGVDRATVARVAASAVVMSAIVGLLY